MARMNAFFAWSTWVCITERPGDDVTYTNNWPHDEAVGNVPPPSLHLWSGFSVLLLLACVGLLVFYHARNKEEEINEALPLEDPLRNMKPTPSMKATLKYICPLWSRRKWFLRHSFRSVSSSICFQKLACPTGNILDCYLMAGYGIVYSTSGFRI